MARVNESFIIGDRNDLTVEKLLLIMERMYTDLARAVNQKPDLVQRNNDGSTTETFLDQGTININLSTNKVEMLTNHQATTVTWTTLS